MQSVTRALKGRGAFGNPDNRFHTHACVAVDDGWQTPVEPDKPVTELRQDSARSIIVYNQSPDVPFDRSINPYRGCEHGCIYCFARPTHAYLDCSPGLDFETQIFYKAEAPELLRKALSKPGYACQPIALGVNTDAYQPVERKLGITRELLKTLLACRHPVGLITKSALIERDLDILQEMAKHNLVHVMLSVTTLDGQLARTLEPRAASPRRRLQTMTALREAGVPVGLLLAPVVPFLNDSDIEPIIACSRQAGAQTAGYVMIRLPHEVKDLFRSWLDRHMPDKAEHIMSRIRDMRGGRDNDARFGQRMVGSGVFADMVRQRFQQAVKRAGFEGLPDFDCSAFRPPAEEPQSDAQLCLF